MNRIIHWLETHQGTCSWKALFGIRCPGCGMQSALIELLKGNLLSSIMFKGNQLVCTPGQAHGPEFRGKPRGINPTTSTPVPFSHGRRGAGDEGD